MALAKFIADAKRSLGPVLNRTGGILYSAADTLSLGEIYILGLNPGGDGGPTIAQDLDALLDRKDNSYLDEKWENRAGSYSPGQAPLQRRVNWLISALGYDLRRVCASNLIFMKSRSESGVNYPGDADLCWPVHERILGLVHPRLVLAFGNSSLSPYAYFRQRFSRGNNEETVPSGHGSWKCRGFDASVANYKLYVAGLPHLSRYSPIGKEEVVEWLKNRIRT
jgi:hypothetical protein